MGADQQLSDLPMTLAKLHPASMNTMKLVAVLLFGVGISIFAFDGTRYTARDTVVELGPLHVTVERSNASNLLPIVGGIALFGGAILLFADERLSARRRYRRALESALARAGETAWQRSSFTPQTSRHAQPLLRPRQSQVR